MEKIDIIFLGTGSSIPTKERNHSAILVHYKEHNILVDCGEGAQRQFRYLDLSPTKISKILISHWHGDHFLGLPALFQTLTMSNYNKTLELYSPENTSKQVELIKKLVNFDLDLKTKDASGIFFKDKEFHIEAMRMKHGCHTNAYSIVFEDKVRLDKKKIKGLGLPNTPLLQKLQQGKNIIYEGKKIKARDVSYIEKGRKLTFIFDTAINENAVKIAKNSDVLVIEASFSSEEKEKALEYMHLTAGQAATIAKKARVKKLVLTHLSQRYSKSEHIILNEAKKIFKNTLIAKDLESITI